TEAHGVLHAVDVGRGARHEVSRARALDDGQRKARHALEELLAQLGEHGLAEHHGRALRVAHEHGLSEHGDEQDEHRLVDDARARPGDDGVDHAPEQPRAGETRGRGAAVPQDDDCERALGLAQQGDRLVAQHARVSDGELHATPPATWVGDSTGASSSWTADSTAGSAGVSAGVSAAARETTRRYWSPCSSSRRNSSRCVPVNRTTPFSTKTTSSTRSSTSGLVLTMTVDRPARAVASRSAMRASVCASTALVGSTSTSTSACVSRARARATRWRWPPESERPFSSTRPSSPPGTESSTSA